MIKVNIDGQEITLEKPMTILAAAQRAGIKIPTLCYDKQLEPFGGCRLCLVEIERVPKLMASCTVNVTDGMVVRTQTEKVKKARKAQLEFLLINHPLDCPVCDKAGECDLQDLVAQYGAHEGRFLEGKRKHPESFRDPIIVRNMERCITCTRCVRMCDGVQGAFAITVTGRGNHSFVEPFTGGEYKCEYCGNCLTVCPVGAIMSKLHRHSYRPWYVEKEIKTICGFCAVGCTLIAQTRGKDIIRTMPKHGLGINDGILCVRGRFGYDYRSGEGRITTPLIRKDSGELEPASWETAIDYAARRLADIKERHGVASIGGIGSGRCTNEDNYMLQKLIRYVIGSNNMDSSARFAFAPAQKYLERMFGQGVTANLIPGIANADGVIVFGGDPTAINPILGVQCRIARRKGAKVIVIGAPAGLKGFVDYKLEPVVGCEEVVLRAIVKGVVDKKGLSGENAYIENKIKKLMSPDDETIERVGVAVADIAKAVDNILKMKSPVVVIGPEAVHTSSASLNLFLLGVINYVLNGRIFLLSEKANYQGLLDMGRAPDVVPGGEAY
ncbi:MAG: 2Fe-2S iron-sulfur cluster-binding protein [Candidatus Magnetoovum sp. WYHC-5]|nr:2Fe-2S iron-sulfur cluster-binding protein [Candidatus Magnetoovum sp. WYHC-5]